MGTHPDVNPLQILCIDDCDDDAVLVGQALRDAGLSAAIDRVDTEAACGRALSHLAWDVILVDASLPGWSAEGAVDLARRTAADTPLIVVSGTIGEEAAVRLMRAGADDVVMKSNLPRLAPVVDRELRQAQVRKERARSEQRLRATQEQADEAALRLSLLVAQLPIALIEFDQGMSSTFATGAALATLGVSPDQALGRQPTELFGHTDEGDAAWERVLGGAPDMYEMSTGSCTLQIWLVPLIDQQRLTCGAAAVAVDVTSRKVAQRSLTRNQELLRDVVSGMPDPVVVKDVDGRYLLANQAAAQMMGHSVKEVIGRNDALLLPADEAAETIRGDTAVMASGQPRSFEDTAVDADGSLRTYLTLKFPRRAVSGKVSGVVGVSRDITARKHVEEELQRGLELLEASNDHRTRLLQKVVTVQEEERRRIATDLHDDTVQSLVALGMRLDLAARKLSDPLIRQEVTDAASTSRRVVARLRHLMFELRPPDFGTRSLAETLLPHLKAVEAADGIEFHVEDRMIDEPPLETRLVIYRAVQEAIANVHKHAHAKHVRVALETRGDGIEVTVTDDGRGFTPADPYEPGHFGLISMRERMELVGGWCRIDSHPDRGTTVMLHAPVGAVRDPAGVAA